MFRRTSHARAQVGVKIKVSVFTANGTRKKQQACTSHGRVFILCYFLLFVSQQYTSHARPKKQRLSASDFFSKQYCMARARNRRHIKNGTCFVSIAVRVLTVPYLTCTGGKRSSSKWHFFHVRTYVKQAVHLQRRPQSLTDTPKMHTHHNTKPSIVWTTVLLYRKQILLVQVLYQFLTSKPMLWVRLYLKIPVERSFGSCCACSTSAVCRTRTAPAFG